MLGIVAYISHPTASVCTAIILTFERRYYIVVEVYIIQIFPYHWALQVVIVLEIVYSGLL